MPHLEPDLLEAFGQHLQERERSKLSVETYLRDVHLFAAWFEEANGTEPTLEAITTTDLREYKQHLRVVRKDQPATINRKLASLRVFLGWAQSSGRLGDHPAPRVPRTVRREQLGPRWLGRRERLALLRAVERGGNRRDITVIRFLFHTGVRVQELCDLASSDVRMSSRKGRAIVRHGKGAKQREVPLNKEARDALEALGFSQHAGSDERIFQGQRGPLSARGIQMILRRYAERAGLDGVTPHILRHTFCKTLINAGAQLQEVAALAGHESLETTRRYCEPSLVDLERPPMERRVERHRQQYQHQPAAEPRSKTLQHHLLQIWRSLPAKVIVVQPAKVIVAGHLTICSARTVVGRLILCS